MENIARDAFQLNGRVAVVTGSAQGIGLGIAEQLAFAGADVVLADVQVDRAKSASDDLNERGLSTRAAHLDVTNSGHVDEFFESVESDLGRIDILTNSAGVASNVMPVIELTDEEWQRSIDVNLTGSFYTSRAAVRIMERQESGAIVNVASINGDNPAALVAAYNASKAGVISLTKTMALELAAYGVRVNAVSPGPTYTDFHKKTTMPQRAQSLNITEEEMVERIRKAIPLGRWGEPMDIGQAVVFLSSSAASWITGQVLRVSGGMEGVSAAPPKRAK
jgi:NAD(P)-dependent dehydrogenase (short-subunit alcohol dehydrogenase family)